MVTKYTVRTLLRIMWCLLIGMAYMYTLQFDEPHFFAFHFLFILYFIENMIDLWNSIR